MKWKKDEAKLRPRPKEDSLDPSSPSNVTSCSVPSPTDGATHSGAEDSEEDKIDSEDTKTMSGMEKEGKRAVKEGQRGKEVSTDENANGVPKIGLATMPSLYKEVETQNDPNSLGR